MGKATTRSGELDQRQRRVLNSMKQVEPIVPPRSPDGKTERLQQEIEAILSDLERLVGELERRGRRLNPVTLVRRHGWVVLASGLLVGVAVTMWRRHRRERHSGGGEIALARKRAKPNPLMTMLSAAGAGAAATLAKGWAKRLLTPAR